MVSRSIVALLVCVALPVAARLSGSNANNMRPEVVSQLLVSVEHKWEHSRLNVLRNATDAHAALAEMQESCIKVASSIIQGSEGDKDRVVEYFEDVCDQDKVSQNKDTCQQFAKGMTSAMTDDQQYNRDELDLHVFCQGVWDGTVSAVAKVQSEKMDEEIAQKQKDAAEEKARKEKEEAEEKARKEKEEAEAKELAEKTKSEEKARKEKEEAEEKVRKEKAEVAEKARKEKAAAEAKALVEKQAEEEKALKEKEEGEANALAEKHAAEAKALKLKAEAEAKALAEKQTVPQAVAKAENQTALAVAAVARTEKVADKEEAKMVADDKDVNKLVETAHKAMALAAIKQDPCAGCAEAFVAQHQKCMATMSNNPCTKQYTGVAFDNQCCGMAQQHARCMSCKSQGSRPHYNSKWTDQLNSGVTVTEGYSK